MHKLFNILFLTLTASLSTGVLAARPDTVSLPSVPNNWRVIVTDNAGHEAAIPSTGERDAMAIAQKSKIASNHSVKVADTLGPLYAWVRVGDGARGKWEKKNPSQNESFD